MKLEDSKGGAASVCRAGFPRGPDGRMLPSQQGGRTGVRALSAPRS